MTIPRMRELTHYWNNSPPIHLLVKQLFAESSGTPQENAHPPTEDELQAFVASFKGA